MELRPGYKQTVVGVIPEDWQLRGLFSAVSIANGQVDPRREPFRSMVLVAPDHIEPGTGKLLAKETAAEQRAISGKYAFEAGDIVYSKIRPYLKKAILADFTGLCSADMYPLRPVDGVVGGYILSVLLAHRFTRYAESVSVRSGMPKINRAELADFSVAVPPLPEQRAIADALNDADALLNGLDRLIAKKRDLKQAAMQQLLTGQTRLPGFHGEWAVKRLGELGPFLKGSGVTKDEARSGDLPCIRYGEIYTHHNDYVRSFNSWISREVAGRATPLRRGDLLFAGSGETKEEIGKCVALVDDVEAYAGGDIIILRPLGVNSLFLGYLVNTPAVASQKASRGQGDAVVHIGASALASINLSLPGLDEQAAIAAVLSDMDAELAALEARRAKTRALKQAMMQELLTGRTRLV
jgi:type I restriction enzyme S subunit